MLHGFLYIYGWNLYEELDSELLKNI